MTQQEIEDTFLDIKEKIKAGKIKNSFRHLEQLLAELDDNDELDKLDDELLKLSSRFSIVEKEKLVGMIGNEEAEKSKEKLISSLVSLLKAVKQVAMTLAS